MIKKISILVLSVILPIIFIQAYTHYFEFAGNWLEDYQNYFKVGFLVVSILGTIWLAVIAKKDKSYIWLTFAIILLILLLAYLLFGLAIINSSY